MYKSSLGKWVYKGGSSGTVTLPKGSKLLQIIVHGTSSPTVVIFGGDTIPIPNNDVVTMRFLHQMAVAPDGTPTIVFSNTTMYFVEYAAPGNP